MQYELKRSKRKTVALEITREARVLVRAPVRMPQGEIERFVEKNLGWIETYLARAQARIVARPDPSPEELEALRARAKTHIPGRVAHFGARMGLVPASVKITSAKTRFGSCSSTNGLCFSCRLMAYPEAAIDYVVVHELAHIIHKNHGKAFYALVESVLPDYRQRRQLLKHPGEVTSPSDK